MELSVLEELTEAEGAANAAMLLARCFNVAEPARLRLEAGALSMHDLGTLQGFVRQKLERGRLDGIEVEGAFLPALLCAERCPWAADRTERPPECRDCLRVCLETRDGKAMSAWIH